MRNRGTVSWGRRVCATAVLSACVASTASCVLGDPAPPSMLVSNESASDLVVTIEGAVGISGLAPVEAGGQVYVETLHDCVGTSIKVETPEGELVGRVTEPGCPDALLTITKNRVLEYKNDG